MNEEQLKEITEKFKETFTIEELDELERQYNAMVKRINDERSGSIQNEE